MAEIDLSSIKALPVAERIKLAQAIWATIPPSDAILPQPKELAPVRVRNTWKIPELTLESWTRFFGSEQLLYLQAADDQLQGDAQRFLQTFGLPQVVQFEGEHCCEISFAPHIHPLAGYNSLIGWGIFFDSELDARLSEQLVIGHEDHPAGVASICVERITGIVNRFDITNTLQQTMVNSSVRQFGQALQVVIEWSDECEQFLGKPADHLSQLESRLRGIDPTALASTEHYWPQLLVTLNNRLGIWKAGR